MPSMLPATIALGERRWTVRPLTVAQVQAIEPLLHQAESTTGSVAAAVAIIRLAIARDDPSGAAGIDAIEAGAPEIAAALATVLRLGGFLPGGALAGNGQAPEAAPA